jgi:hypothetical protein
MKERRGDRFEEELSWALLSFSSWHRPFSLSWDRGLGLCSLIDVFTRRRMNRRLVKLKRKQEAGALHWVLVQMLSGILISHVITTTIISIPPFPLPPWKWTMELTRVSALSEIIVQILIRSSFCLLQEVGKEEVRS